MLYNVEGRTWEKDFEITAKKMINSSKDIQFSQHVKNKVRSAYNREFDIADITKDLLTKGKVFEVEVENNKINKFLIRMAYTDKRDLIAVCIIKLNKLFIKTIWTNDKMDTHLTLDKSKYN